MFQHFHRIERPPPLPGWDKVGNMVFSGWSAMAVALAVCAMTLKPIPAYGWGHLSGGGSERNSASRGSRRRLLKKVVLPVVVGLGIRGAQHVMLEREIASELLADYHAVVHANPPMSLRDAVSAINGAGSTGQRLGALGVVLRELSKPPSQGGDKAEGKRTVRLFGGALLAAAKGGYSIPYGWLPESYRHTIANLDTQLEALPSVGTQVK